MVESNWPKKFRTLLERNKNPRLVLQLIRGNISSIEIQNLFDQLGKNPIFRNASAPYRAPVRFEQLASVSRLATRSLLIDLTWTAEVIRLFAAELNAFLEAEGSLENHYIRGEFLECLSTLESLEAKSGLSLWLISRKSAILRKIPTHNNSDYTNSLVAAGSQNNVMNWIAYIIGYRADPNVSAAGFLRQLNRTLDDPGMPDRLLFFLRYASANLLPSSADQCAGLLGHMENFSLIDRYICLIDVLQHLVCTQSISISERSAVEVTLSRLANAVNDPRIRLMWEIVTGDTENLLVRLDPDAADLYTEGDYVSASALLINILEANPRRASLFNLLARASLRTEHFPDVAPQMNELLRNIGAVYSFADDSDAAASNLLRELVSGTHRPLAYAIRALFADQSNDPSVPTQASALEAINCAELTPSQLRCLEPYMARPVMPAAVDANPHSLAVVLQEAISRFGDSELDVDLARKLPSERASLYQARSLLQLGRYADAIAIFAQFESHPLQSVANDARRELFSAFLAAGHSNDALRLVARAHNVNERLHALFKLEPLIDHIEESGAPPFDEVALSICYSIHNRFSGSPRLGAQADAAEEFALAHGASLPSAIDLALLRDDENLIRIYLDEVCAPQILDKFMAIEEPGDVEVERLAICRILSEADATNRQRYLDEIREITRRRVVRDRFAQVERTKIYVDSDGVKSQAEKLLRDNFLRFIATLEDQSQGNERVEMMRKVQSIIATVDADGVRIHFPDLPGSERDLIFEKLVGDVMRMLVSSKEYGLEAYLSTRVRHGTMGNQLRSAYEVHALLTQKDGEQYQADTQWADSLGLNDSRRYWLAERLAKFSEDIDAAIGDLVRRRIQVWTEASPDGLFIFQTYNYHTLQIQAEMSIDTSFDQFMDRVIEQFWEVLEDTLSVVRDYIKTKFIATIYNITDNLERDLTRELIGLNYSALQDAIAAGRTQMAVNTGTVASWFTLALDLERPDYEYDIALEVALESIRACHPRLGLTLQRSDSVGFECRGRSLESLVYILFTALDNAVEHSGMTEHAPDIHLDTSIEDGWLNLVLVNSCVPIVDVDSSNRTLAELLQRLETSTDLHSLATKEGGSGYAKIIRILRHELSAAYSLSFGYINDTHYEVRIGVEARQIIK